MSVACKMMWLPMAVSGLALAAGLAGVVLTGEWKLLLVLAAATGLSETIEPNGDKSPFFPRW